MLHRPAECAQNVCSARKPTPGTLPSLGPLEGERNCCLSHSVTRYHRLSPSPSCMSPATWEAKAENEGQMGEANENFSILFLSFGEIKIGIH